MRLYMAPGGSRDFEAAKCVNAMDLVNLINTIENKTGRKRAVAAQKNSDENENESCI